MCNTHICQMFFGVFGILIFMEFGKRFKKLRLQNGYTQQQVADKLGVRQSNVSDWENNISRPEYENLIALARLYDETLESLLGLDGGK